MCVSLFVYVHTRIQGEIYDIVKLATANCGYKEFNRPLVVDTHPSLSQGIYYGSLSAITYLQETNLLVDLIKWGLPQQHQYSVTIGYFLTIKPQV